MIFSFCIWKGCSLPQHTLCACSVSVFSLCVRESVCVCSLMDILEKNDCPLHTNTPPQITIRQEHSTLKIIKARTLPKSNSH